MTTETYLDIVKAELIANGCTRQQSETKVVPVLVDILMQSGDKYRKIDELQKQIASLKSEVERWKDKAQRARRDANAEEKHRYEIVMQEWRDAPQYIQDFLKCIEECETEEGRDAIKRAQLFRNSINVETKYDNTSYIIGLAAILSNGKIGAIDELKKINRKINCNKIITSGNRERKFVYEL